MDSKQENTTTNDSTATVPLAYHEVCMTREKREKWWIVLCWAASLILTVGLFVFLWLQYDYIGYTDNTGVYVLTDSQGNVIASDLEPEDVIRIMQELQDGQSSESSDP